MRASAGLVACCAVATSAQERRSTSNLRRREQTHQRRYARRFVLPLSFCGDGRLTRSEFVHFFSLRSYFFSVLSLFAQCMWLLRSYLSRFWYAPPRLQFRLAASPSADRVVAPRVERTLFEAWLSGRRGPTKDGGLKVSPPDGAKGGKTRLSGQDQGVEDQHQN